VGVVGTGWIGSEHLADLAARTDVDIVAVADRDREQAQLLGKRYNVRGFGDCGELLAAQPLDAIWICTPPQHHLAPAAAAFKAGVAVYLEKPIARSLEEASRIAELAEQAGEVCAIGYQWHSLDVLGDLRDALADQRIGALLAQSIGPTKSRPWFLDGAQSGGNLLERGSHHIDLIRAVAGEVTAVQVVASGVSMGHGNGQVSDIDDALTLILHLAGGAIATIVIAWTQPGTPSTYSLDVMATDAVLQLQLDPHFTLSGVSCGTAVNATSTVAPFSRSNSRFLEAVAAQDRTLVSCRPRDALQTLAVALAGEQSLASGQRVDVLPAW